MAENQSTQLSYARLQCNAPQNNIVLFHKTTFFLYNQSEGMRGFVRIPLEKKFSARLTKRKLRLYNIVVSCALTSEMRLAAT